ncbi:sugar nucleotide-binding protein [Streptosporangium sp. NPDC023963]|uniref:sugar nucleotide-binding protein n=1 Tax=Streptosporangium sp. NPDC023963 TaxID=3155608 RepID=UPI003436195A
MLISNTPHPGTGNSQPPPITGQSRKPYSPGRTYLTRSGEIAGVEWLPLDIRRREEADALIGAWRPEVVVNAAYRQTDWATTAVGAANVALATFAAGGRLVHVSSDAVFSGAAIHYDETSDFVGD